ncbi:phosphatase PAP2 family protein [Chitinophaga lutea]|uniref:Phosphatase PAP2 family protein n=1 Tax=Chitinophaga lutea TaxID=2488634 RepID=A0A3N4PG40_9BACT|nr:vanadium-dependent haloperoxidase [Chitinophaga lutea]RPE05479.1 phosphatase PAP2 family protein [Chitinophaga lutea]
MKSICLLTRMLSITLIFSMLACNKEKLAERETLSAETMAAIDVQSLNGGAAVPVSWYKLELKLIKESSGFTPPVAARAIAYTGITLHEAVVWGTPWGHTLSGQLNGLSNLPKPEKWKKYNWAIAANSAMAQAIKDLFPNASAANQQLITQLEADNLAALADSCSQAEVDRSIYFGRQIATAIYQWSSTDGGKDGYLNNFPTDYVPPVGPGLWVSTPPQFQRAMLPYWGNNRLLLKFAPSDTAGAAFPAYSTDTTSAFYQAAKYVYQKGISLTPEENLIARYWADGGGTFTPPGHLIAITAQLVNDEDLSLTGAAKLFAQVGIGLNDAAILCWRHKYRYNVLRPVTYIRAQIDSSWMPLIGTPPFPSFTSGHSTFTSVSGHIMAARFGNSFSFTDHQKVPDGFAPRPFANFQAMINEAAISRVYGGIHYDFDSEVGKTAGYNLALRVLALQY